VKARYNLQDLIFEEAAFCHHYQLSYQYYHDPSKGLSIAESQGTKEVGSIGWRAPELKRPASIVNRCKSSASATLEEIK
jgi:hypothetical protein